MGKASRARVAAASLLGDVRRRDARARDLLRASDRMRALDARERALASRLVLGVVGASGLLDQVLARHLVGRRRVEPKVRDALRLGANELLFLSTASAVAVSQGVELVRRAQPRAAGMANAVLRRVADEDVPRRAAAIVRMRDGGDDLADWALVSGYPAWLLELVARDRGAEAARDLAWSATEPAPVYVAANEGRCSSAELAAILDARGLAPHVTDLDGAYVLEEPAGLARSGLVDEAMLVVADLSAQRVARLVEPAPGTSVLEVGQGRGTKSILLQGAALRAGGVARVVGIDAEPFKVEVARRRMSAAGLADSVSCSVFDACELGGATVPARLAGPFDIVFVDAPCSGTGTLRRHPEIAWGLAPEDVRSLAALQLRMLEAAATRVRAGGSLCYATCSIVADEDEGVVDAFLGTEVGADFTYAGPPFASLPSQNGPDGHYCAKLIRNA